MDDEKAASEAVEGLDGVYFSGGTIKVEVCFIRLLVHALVVHLVHESMFHSFLSQYSSVLFVADVSRQV